MSDVVIALLMSLIAGLATGIGACAAFFAKSTNKKFLCGALGFSSGVMLYVAMIEIFGNAVSSATEYSGEAVGGWIVIGSFFGGIILIAAIENLIPSIETQCKKRGDDGDRIAGSELINGAAGDSVSAERSRLMRMGVVTALALAIHNFPEGLATFVSALNDPELAVPVVVAISIHNIPEGIAVSVPMYQATGSRVKAFIFSFLSGLAEPVGALLGWLILMPFMNELVFGIIFAVVAGIMVYIAIAELLPSAREYGSGGLTTFGVVIGMAVMAISIMLFK